MKRYKQYWLEKVDGLILSNLQNPNFRLLDITKELKISPAHFYRRMVALTGISPNKYIRQTRLEQAKERLLLGEYSTVKETAKSVGYLQPEYFTKLFKEEYHVFPKDVLKGKIDTISSKYRDSNEGMVKNKFI